MTPADQIKELAKMLAPENPNDQHDAVFLVTKELTRLHSVILDKDKQIALLEAKLEAEGLERSAAVNAKLAADARRNEAELERDIAKGIERDGPTPKPIHANSSDGRAK